MSDLIERQAAIDKLPYLLDYDGLKGENGFVSKRLVRKMLKELPPAESERKTGAWIPYDTIPRYVICRCTACGTDILVPCMNDKTIFNYCPNCGAKMEEKQYE